MRSGHSKRETSPQELDPGKHGGLLGNLRLILPENLRHHHRVKVTDSQSAPEDGTYIAAPVTVFSHDVNEQVGSESYAARFYYNPSRNWQYVMHIGA
ncbi:MAG: hypothetical protein V7746_24510 [Halioglobus sp.]